MFRNHPCVFIMFPERPRTRGCGARHYFAGLSRDNTTPEAVAR